jgi:ABC-type polysaccharide/polyol phosphate transport system ATPase subunit
MNDTAISVNRVSKRFRVPLDHASGLLDRLSRPVSTSRYRELHALEDVTFSVSRGEFLGITGPNGCGKTTLLKILTRIYEPDAGRVLIRGRVSPFIELGVGFKHDLTARENIFLAGALHGVTREQLVDRVDDVLEFAELAGFADQRLRNFSSGMVVRLAFSVAMLADADILLMDEVLAVGDPHFQEKCFDVFDYYKRSNRTIVLVTHDLAALEAHCDRVLLIESGRVVGDGAPSEIVADYRRRVAAISDQEADPHATQTMIAPASRWGSGEVDIVEMRVLGADGQRRSAFASGERVTVAVDYEIKRHVPELVCALAVRRFDGTGVAEASTKLSQIRMLGGGTGTRGTVTYEIPSIPLLSGHYLLSGSLYDGQVNHMYDHLEDVLAFRITDDKGRPGVVELGGTWAHTSDAEAHAAKAAIRSPSN